MNKLAAILISLFYLTVTVGLAVNAHYCHGELESVGLYGQTDDCCCGDVSGDGDCCHNVVQHITLDDEQAPGSRPDIQPQVFDLLITEDRSGDLPAGTGQPPFVSTSDFSPADLPAWLLFCSLVYYG
ncbi:MAG: hypothetical protein AAGU19_12295 [Prolixibacteraceae bacterium]